jgi:hypothetical protein
VTYVKGNSVTVKYAFAGDGGVLYSSAAMPGLGTAQSFGRTNHIALPRSSSVQKFILDHTIASNGSPGRPKALSNGLRGFFSDVDFMFVDPQGRRLGYTAAGGFVDEIADARVSTQGGRQVFFLPDLGKRGNYTLTLTGTAAGQYAGSLSRARNQTVRTLGLGGPLADGEDLTDSII